MEIIILITLSCISLVSIIGYGITFQSLFLKNKNILNLGLVGFLGLFFLSSISYFTHFFLRHGETHNLILLIIGLIFFSYYFKNKKIDLKKEYFILLFFLLIGIFIGKSHDDFGYYHLPNALHFVSNKIEFGLGNLNHGFKHHSSIFYLYSIFYLPYVKFYLFNVINFFFLLFSILFFTGSIIEDLNQSKFSKLTIIKVLFAILFIAIFNRVGEYGTDITGQLLAGVLLYLVYDLVIKKNITLIDIFIIITFIAYLITIKTYFALYVLFLLNLTYLIIDKGRLINNLIKSNLFLFLIFVGLMFIVINISSTGCVIYPVSSLCYPKVFEWGLDLNTINYMSNWYEIWSKAGAGPDFIQNDPSKYIEGFNWINNWVDKYFFTKVSDFLLSIFTGCLIFLFIFRKQLSFKFILDRDELYFFLTLLVLFMIWFYKFPSLRYGGHILIISIIILLFISSIKIEKFNFLLLKKKILTVFSISLLVFCLKNLNRLHKEFNYEAIEKFENFPYFYVPKIKYEKIYINNELVYKVDGMCWSTPSPCLRNINREITRKYGFRIYFNK